MMQQQQTVLESLLEKLVKNQMEEVVRKLLRGDADMVMVKAEEAEAEEGMVTFWCTWAPARQTTRKERDIKTPATSLARRAAVTQPSLEKEVVHQGGKGGSNYSVVKGDRTSLIFPGSHHSFWRSRICKICNEHVDAAW